MNERQRRVREAFVSGRPWIGEALGEALDKIRYPAIFLDFETTSSAIPTYPGTRPYQQVCFQWSAHVLGSESGKPVHHEFLACDEADPRAEFCRSLWKLLRKCDSIVHYTAFEISQIRGMAEEGVPLAAELLQAFSARSLDLEKLVAEHVYFESFCGRTSIKVVLPTLVPGMSYKNLRISDGNAAATAFRKMLAKAEEAPELRSALLEYCCQDTLAMVEIYRALRRLAKQPALF